jgi:hypothetical protein
MMGPLGLQQIFTVQLSQADDIRWFLIELGCFELDSSYAFWGSSLVAFEADFRFSSEMGLEQWAKDVGGPA